MKRVLVLLLLLAETLSVHAQRAGRSRIPFNGGFLYAGSGTDGLEGDPRNAVIFLHAGFQDQSMWEKQAGLDLGSYDRFYIDLPGHGQSLDGPRRANADSILLAVYDYFHLEKAALVSLSFGSAVALEFASRHPERVSRLVLASPGMEGFDEVQPLLPSTLESFNAMFAAFEAGDTVKAAEGFVKTWYAGPHRKSADLPEALYKYGMETTLRNMRQHRASGWPEFQKPTTMHRVRNVTMPVLLLVGDKDMPEVFRVAAWLRQNLQHAQLVHFPNAAHMINLEDPARFNMVVRKFLNKK